MTYTGGPVDANISSISGEGVIGLKQHFLGKVHKLKEIRTEKHKSSVKWIGTDLVPDL